MPMVLEDPLKRYFRYKAKTDEAHIIARAAYLNAIRDSYTDMAKSYDALAADARRARRLKKGDPSN